VPAGDIVKSGRPPERPPLHDVLRLVDVQLAHSTATQEHAGYTLPDRRLLIFDVLGRRADGQLIRFRAMADTGSTGEFISPQAAKRGGFQLASGSFGHAVEAFGSSTPLTQRALGVQLTFNGELSGSGLAAAHSSINDLTVAPLCGYDILLGTRFLDSVRGVIDVYNRAITMRDADGRDIHVQGHGRPATTGAHEMPLAAATSTDSVGWEELTQHEPAPQAAQRVSAINFTRAAQNLRTQIANLAMTRRPDLVITAKQFDRERRRGGWANARIFCIHGGERYERETQALPSQGTVYRPGSSPPGPDQVCSITVSGGVMRTEVCDREHATWTHGPGARSAEATATTKQPPARQTRGTHDSDQRHREAQMCAALTDELQNSTGASRHGGDLAGLAGDERRRAQACLTKLEAEYADVFPAKLTKLPPHRGAEPFKIELKPGAEPKGSYGARMTAEEHREGAKMMAELVGCGFVRPSRSPWGAPMFLVAKPDGTKRMVIDYRLLNAQTIRNRYPLPRVGELFDQLGKARYFSKIDLRSGYWQIRVDEGSIDKTAFTSRFGHYEWLVLPMGLTNAPAAFMSLMEDTFREELNKFVLLFLDDILIYSDTLEEHERHLRVVLQRLRDKQLFAKRSKCSFFCSEVEFLGHYVGRDGLRMVEDKVASVENWPTPTCQSDVEQFLGLAGYYRPFIRDLSKLAAPLAALTGRLRKGKGVRAAGGGKPTLTPRKAWHWGEREEASFRAVKAAITRAPCLAIADSSKPFVVHTDASGYATGAVLMQDQGKGLQPIAFMSKKMNDAERNYPVHEQELLAIKNALTTWSHYLRDRHFTVVTDHQSLQYVESNKMATSRLVRWRMQLADFDFDIRYERGEQNVVADALSRTAAGKTPESATAMQVQAQTQTGQAPDVSLLATLVEMVHSARQSRAAAAAASAATASAASAAAEVPSAAQQESLPLAFAQQLQAAAARDADYQRMASFSDEERAEHGLQAAAHSDEGYVYTLEGKLMLPNDGALRTAALDLAHDGCAHQGRDRTYHWLAERCYWPGMQQEVAQYVRGCERCQRAKPSTQGAQGMPKSLDIPAYPWHTIGMDWIGPFAMSPRGHDYVLVVTCKFGGGVVYIPTAKDADAGDTLRLIRERVVAEHGWPAAIISDSDARFRSALWTGFWQRQGTKLLRGTAYHPQTDGITERANRTMVEALRACVQQNPDDWDLLLPDVQLAVNSSRNASTGFTPYFMTHGREARTGLDAQMEQAGVQSRPSQHYPGAVELARAVAQAAEQARTNMAAAQAKQRADSERGRRAPVIGVGDWVLVTTANARQRGPLPAGHTRKLQDRFSGPYEVLEMRGDNAARLRLPAGDRRHPTLNLDKIKLWVDGTRSHPHRRVYAAAGAGAAPAAPATAAAATSAAAAPAGSPPPFEYLNDDNEPVYEAESILEAATEDGRRWYRVKWRGYGEDQATWQFAEDLTDAAELVQRFETQQTQQRRAAPQPHRRR
jgi:RNase H-like domain found in reverse transcriptase/Reverse transcriptase (RNA-dependent DNA polymerase)/Integrase zinc binding domain/Chromo (CHRromatin Organisation MOdifier) domain